MTQRCRFSGRAGLGTAAVPGRPRPRPPPVPPPARGVRAVVRVEGLALPDVVLATLPGTRVLPVVGALLVAGALLVVPAVPVGLLAGVLPPRPPGLDVAPEA